MAETDTSGDSRRGFRLALFAALLGAYLISSILPVTTYTMAMAAPSTSTAIRRSSTA
jgi:hypothetical protein